MFELTTDPIDPRSLAEDLRREAAGALVTFEGWVRDHNEGRSVTGLEYEAYEELALGEGLAVLEEVLQEHRVLAARCVHRVGRLSIGEVAIWIGVSAAHRAEAFAACRALIDGVKARVPIWKKELYVGAPARWVACHQEPAE